MADIADAERDLPWQVESLRLTALFPTKDPGTAENLWNSITDEGPEEVVVRKGAEQSATGPLRGLKLSLDIRPERVDWLLSQGAGNNEESLVPNSGEFSHCLDVLRHIVSTWTTGPDCPSFQRVALGAVLLAPTENRECGYTALIPYLPAIKLDPGESRDFSYQINRPRISKCLGTDMTINRLSKWSVALFNRTILVGGKARPQPVQSKYACRLELDINTDAEFGGELTPRQIGEVFVACSELAAEIVGGGDCP